MGTWLEVELCWLANGLEDDVLRIVRTVGDRGVEDVRDLVECVAQAVLDITKLGLGAFKPLTQGSHGGDAFVAFRLVPGLANLLAHGVPFGTHVFDVLDALAAAGIEVEDIVDRGVGAAPCNIGTDALFVLADELGGQHV